MPVSIDIDQQEASPFEQEPRLIGFYHWNRSIRTMHQHENCIELNFMISGNGTHIVGNEICHTQPATSSSTTARSCTTRASCSTP